MPQLRHISTLCAAYSANFCVCTTRFAASKKGKRAAATERARGQAEFPALDTSAHMRSDCELPGHMTVQQTSPCRCNWSSSGSYTYFNILNSFSTFVDFLMTFEQSLPNPYYGSLGLQIGVQQTCRCDDLAVVSDSRQLIREAHFVGSFDLAISLSTPAATSHDWIVDVSTCAFHPTV